MRKKILLLILQTVLLASCTSTKATPTPKSSGIALVDCVLMTPGVDTQVDAKCGSLAVSEDPANPKSRQINLNVAVVEAVQRSSESNPLFILVGGPGQSAVEVFPAIYSSLFRIHEKRDIVLVDQRGTGKSNPLRCLDPKDEALDDERTIALLKACPGKLDADLRYYTTDIAMQDLDKVRSALGYETINLYGVSYGTRAALVYLKMYPAHVRSLILDAVVDPKFVLYQDVARDGQRALDLFFTRCEKDKVCNTSFPMLRSEFDALLKKIKATPVDIEIPHPVTGEQIGRAHV
jgi:pimeloyl-ACP methyl ester carboxylesterase